HGGKGGYDRVLHRFLSQAPRLLTQVLLVGEGDWQVVDQVAADHPGDYHRIGRAEGLLETFGHLFRQLCDDLGVADARHVDYDLIVRHSSGIDDDRSLAALIAVMS